MQESTSNDNHPGGRARGAGSRHRLPAQRTGRGRRLSYGAGAFVCAGLAAGALALTGDGPLPAVPAPAPGEQAVTAGREDLVDRADRFTRTIPDSPATATGQNATGPATPDAPRPKAIGSRAAAPPAPPAPRPAPAWTHPMPGAEVTSCYGMRWGSMHRGVDLSMPYGTPIRAVGSGTVVRSGWNGGYGISVIVDHGNGYLSHYAHMSDSAVGTGRRVRVGQVLGYEGSTGSSTGPHLHLEVHRGMGNTVNPASWLRNRGVEVGGC